MVLPQGIAYASIAGEHPLECAASLGGLSDYSCSKATDTTPHPPITPSPTPHHTRTRCATVQGLPNYYGLYSSFMGVIVYCFMGSSRDISLGQ